MSTTFTPRFGYIPTEEELGDDVRLSVALDRLGMRSARPPASYDSGVRSEPVVQAYDDCVPVTIAKSMRKRIVLQRTPEERASLPWPEPLSARWGYWHWLESKGKLGQETTGTEPFKYVQLLNERGWCAEQFMPYAVDGVVPRINDENAPSVRAFKRAYDQVGMLKAHTLLDNDETRVAIAADLAVCLSVACDVSLVSGGVPNDPDYVWDFDESSRVAGWHMVEAESYDERGVWCQNAWGGGFAYGGYFRIGWRTLANARRAMAPLGIDWVAMTSEELARARTA